MLKQVDVVPKNQALCCKLNLFFAIQCIEMTSREQRLITKEQMAMHTNLFLWFNPLDTHTLVINFLKVT